ncbi:MAG: hypothetical protein J0M29_18125 [Chitinophagales bacterium]|nr:hypothetical protein [Chitinophagales bacterium]
MSNSYLLEIIKTLTPNQLEEFSKFLIFSSGSSKNSKELNLLFDAIQSTSPNFSEEQLKKELVYSKVFQNQNHIHGKLEKLMVELTKILRNYLLFKRYITDNNERTLQLDWIAWLRDHGQDNRAHQFLAKFKNSISQDTEQSLERYKLDFLIAEEEHELQSLQYQFHGNLFIPELIQALDRHYANYRIELVNRYLLIQKSLILPDLDQLLEQNASKNLDDPLFEIATKIETSLKMEDPTPSMFYNLLETLKQHEARISFQSLSQYYTFLRTFCTSLINSGRTQFVEVLHKINLDNLERGLFFINNEIASHAYGNIVHIAIRVKEYQWALEFTEKYKKRIIGGDPNQFFYQMNLSLCLFALKRYDEAITNLPDPSLHLHYQGTIRCLELKIYYEMQSDLLLYKMYAFRKYFERTATKTVSTTLRTMYIEFFNIMLQLTQSPPKDKKRSQQLIDRINKKKLLADRAWLLEKARELG